MKRLSKQIEEKITQIEEIKKQSESIETQLEQVKKSFEEVQREAESIGKSSDMTGNEINNLYIKLSEFRSEIGNSDSSAQDADEQLEMLENKGNS